VGLSVGQFPISYAVSESEVEEERRLFYVALTRARERLALSWAKRSKAGSGSERQMSPFLASIGVAA